MSVGECYRYAASSLGHGKHVVICLTQLAFHNQYFFIYLFSAKTANRIIGYFEEEAYCRYSEYLAGIGKGAHENGPAPTIAIKYWKLRPMRGSLML
jgi:ubiquinol oxidase